MFLKKTSVKNDVHITKLFANILNNIYIYIITAINEIDSGCFHLRFLNLCEHNERELPPRCEVIVHEFQLPVPFSCFIPTFDNNACVTKSKDQAASVPTALSPSRWYLTL